MARLSSPAHHVLLLAALSSLLHLPASALPTLSSEAGFSSQAVASTVHANVDIVNDLLSDHASEDNSRLKKEESDYETQTEDLEIDEEVEMSDKTESSVEDHATPSEDDVVDVNRLSESTGTSSNQANSDVINKTQQSLYNDEDMKTLTTLLQEDSERNKAVIFAIGGHLLEDKVSLIATESSKSLPPLDVIDDDVFSVTEASVILSGDTGGRLVESGPTQDETPDENDSAISSEDVVGDAITAIGGGVRALGIGPLEETDKDGEDNREEILTSSIGPTNLQIGAFVVSIALLVGSGIMIYFIATISKETDSDNADLVVPLSKIPYIRVETAEVLCLEKVQ